MTIDSVVVKGLGKRFGLHRALHAVDLELHSGGVCALLGANGAGKSTLLGILSSLIRPTSGSIHYLDGETKREAGAALRGDIGVVAHESFLYPGLTALENLNFWGRLYGVDALEERSREMLVEVGLEEKAWERCAGTYSRGMVQRLSVARTMLHSPSVLLLDEPFTGLDRGGSQALAEALERAVSRGAVVLVITHDLESIAGITTHVAVLCRGTLAFEERRETGYSFEALKETYHAHCE